MLVLAFIIGVTFSVLIGLVGGVKVPTDTSALRDDGRLRGGLDDPNYLAAGIVPSLALAAGLFPGIRSALGRFALAGACIALVIGLGATESRGGLIAAFVAIFTGVIIAKRGRVFVVAFLVIIIGVGCVWFASDPAAYKRVTHTADKGNGRSSLWIVGGRIWKDHPIHRGGARQLPRLRAALRGLRRTAHVRGLHRRASPRRAQRVPPDDGGGGPRGPGASS